MITERTPPLGARTSTLLITPYDVILAVVVVGVNIAGVVSDIRKVQPTVGRSGKLVRTMVLSDPNGCHIAIRQLGSAAGDLEV